MVDRLTKERRSWLMSRVGSSNTSPEMVVRRTAHALGFRFRLHRKDLPGTPDLVFPTRKAIVLVHGCFWHRHENCKKTTSPKTQIEFWQEKFARNVERDERIVHELEDRDWKVLVVWQCETADRATLAKRLESFLRPRSVGPEDCDVTSSL